MRATSTSCATLTRCKPCWPGELEAANDTVATNVAVTFHPGAGVELLDASGFPLDRDGGAVTLRAGALRGGAERRIWTTWKVPTGAEASHALGSLTLSHAPRNGEPMAIIAELPHVACHADEAVVVAGFDADTWQRGVIEGRLQPDARQRVARGEGGQEGRSPQPCQGVRIEGDLLGRVILGGACQRGARPREIAGRRGRQLRRAGPADEAERLQQEEHGDPSEERRPSMSLLNRLASVVQADAHGVVDALEDRRLLLRQTLREAELELDRKTARHETLVAEAEQLSQARDRLTQVADAADADVEMALGRGEQELARFAARKLLSARRELADVEKHLTNAKAEAERLGSEVQRQEGELADLRRSRARAPLPQGVRAGSRGVG